MVGRDAPKRRLITRLQAYRRTRTFYRVDAVALLLGQLCAARTIGTGNRPIGSRRFAAPRLGPKLLQPDDRVVRPAPASLCSGSFRRRSLCLRAKLAPGVNVNRSIPWQSSPVRSAIRPGKAGGRSRRSTARRPLRHGGNQRQRECSLPRPTVERSCNAELRHQPSAGSSAPTSAPRGTSGIVRLREAARRAFPHLSQANPKNDARP